MPSQRTTINLILLLCLMVLAALFLLSEDPGAATTFAAITGGEPDAILSVTLQRAEHDPLEFVRGGEHWYMRDVPGAVVNPHRIQAMLGLLRTSPVARMDPTGLDLAALGLDHPPVSLALGTFIFRFGATSPMDNKRYVMFGGQVFVIEDLLYPQLVQSREFFLQAE